MSFNAEVLKNKGYSVPLYDREKVKKNTNEAPFWVHFGAGNIFRAFQANVVENLLNDGSLDRGLVVAEGYDYEIIEKMNAPFDGYHILVTLNSDGTVKKTLVGSVVESLTVNPESHDMTRLIEIFSNPSLQMASFTITEKGYVVKDTVGDYTAAVKADISVSPEKAQSYIGKVASLLYARYKAGAYPIAMVSMDNCSHNGDKLYAAINAFAAEWVKNGVAEAGFVAYVNDKNKVSFPWSMIDKITPRPDASVEKMLRDDGIEGLETVITSKNTYVAPFVNAEKTEYLVIEDSFPNGRPSVLEKGGIIFTARETVDKVEKMKVCTCLNPLHTALAIYGCLLGYNKISDEMNDKTLKRLVERVGYEEGLPVVVDPGVLDPREFIDTVINERLPNPFMPDTPQRIATDTSQKLAIRFGETVKAYVASDVLDVRTLEMIPLVFAGYIRYLTAKDDCGNVFVPSSDPRLDALRASVDGLRAANARERTAEILADKALWGVDLFEVGLADKVVCFLEQMLAGDGAIRATLEKYVL